MRLVILMLLLLPFGGTRAGEYRALHHKVGLLHLYRAEPEELSIHWQGRDGTPKRTFQRLESELAEAGKRAVFLMNAGIFEPGGIPSGLHVQAGKEMRPLNLADGRGNFFLKPNGVFFIGGDGAHVVEAGEYAKAAPRPRLALQSGPLLLRGGQTHPAFRLASESKLHRNGVGILPDGRILFVMTDMKSGTRVNLFTFAQLFRQFGCQDALFLDGDLSIMVVDNEGDANDFTEPEDRELAPGVPAGNHFGAILAVVVEDDLAPPRAK
ncbi:hypothetical protein BH23VER1_BH23VER1_00430 [soil metagenome]